MRDENLQIALLEKQILKCLMDNPHLLEDEDIDYFVSPQADEMYLDLLELKNEGKSLIAEHILLKDNNFLDSASLVKIQETEYDVESFGDYKQQLHRKKLVHTARTHFLEILNEDISDEEKIRKLSEEWNLLVEGLEFNSKGKYYSFKDIIDNHIKVEEKRKKGIKTSTGDFNLDKLMPNPTAGICTLCAFSGVGKSTVVQHFLKVRLAKRMYSTFVNTELSLEGVGDGLLSSMINEFYRDVMGIDNDDDRIDYDTIINKLRVLSEHYEDKHYFEMYPKNSLNLDELEKFNLDARKRFGMKDDELLFCFVDLLSMVQEFRDNKDGNSTADSINKGMDKLNDIALRDNILFIATWQLKRMNNIPKIEKIEQLETYFTPRINMLKGSGAIEERSRWCFGVENFYNGVHKNPCDPLVQQLVEPIISIVSMKDTYVGETGRKISYYFDTDYKDLVPMTDEEMSEVDSVINNLESKMEEGDDEE